MEQMAGDSQLDTFFRVFLWMISRERHWRGRFAAQSACYHRPPDE